MVISYVFRDAFRRMKTNKNAMYDECVIDQEKKTPFIRISSFKLRDILQVVSVMDVVKAAVFQYYRIDWKSYVCLCVCVCIFVPQINCIVFVFNLDRQTNACGPYVCMRCLSWNRILCENDI